MHFARARFQRTKEISFSFVFLDICQWLSKYRGNRMRQIHCADTLRWIHYAGYTALDILRQIPSANKLRQ